MRVWTGFVGDKGVWGTLGLSADEGELPADGDEGMGIERAIWSCS